MKFGYKKQTHLSFSDALEKTRGELEKMGFGIITEIDAKTTFKRKLNVDFDDYVILGACHPESAYKVLQSNKQLGLMLPCNVVVYRDKEDVFISTILPMTVLNIVDDSDLNLLASEIEKKLKAVVDSI